MDFIVKCKHASYIRLVFPLLECLHIPEPWCLWSSPQGSITCSSGQYT